MIDFPKTDTRPSWSDQVQESPDNLVDAFFELLGKRAIGLQLAHQYKVLRKQYNRLTGHFVYSRDGFFCQLCGADLLADVNAMMSITKDHVVPKSKGGLNNTQNLVCAYWTCNYLKANAACNSLEDAQRIVTRLRQDRAKVLMTLRAKYR